MKKRLLSVIMAITIILTSISPVYAVLPDDLTERTNEYTVIINSGNGTILQNKDETINTQVGVAGNNQLVYDYIDAAPEDFFEISQIELSIREEETIKNHLNYSKLTTKDIFLSTIEVYCWDYEGFVTSTKSVRSILQNGLNTNFKPGGRGIDDIRVNIYPAPVSRAYLFVPNAAEQVFSHFEDQDGNIFTLETPITKDLVLTPIYVSEDDVLIKDTFFGTEIHSVTILPGEGRLQKLKNSWEYSELDDSYYEDMEQLSLVVKHGDVDFVDITAPYSRLKYGDIERSDIFLQEGKVEFEKLLEENKGKEALECFEQLAAQANSIWFTDAGFINSSVKVDDAIESSVGENRYSLLFLLLCWTAILGEDSTSMEYLETVLEGLKNYDELEPAEQEELLFKAKFTLNAFKNKWDSEVVNKEYADTCLRYLFLNDAYKEEGVIENIFLSETPYPYPSNADKQIIRLKTPPAQDNHSYYVFSHFEDQDGNIFNLGEPVTKDLVLTPIYYDMWDYRSPTAIKCNVYVNTEDNSTESFEVSVNRELVYDAYSLSWYDKYPVISSVLLKAFTPEELKSDKITPDEFLERINEATDYHFDKNSIHINEWSGYVDSFFPPLYEYLNDKSAYTFNEADWEITQEGKITDYKGDFGLIGIPDSINGITVKSMAVDTFFSLYNRFAESYNGYSSELNSDYIDSLCALWIPSTLIDLQNGIGKSTFDSYLNSILESAETEEEKELYMNLIQFYSFEEQGTDDSTPLNFLPSSYIVVDMDNPVYASKNGCLYNKDITSLLYLSFAAEADFNLYFKGYYRNGMEIPKTVTSISSFANTFIPANRGNVYHTILHLYQNNSIDFNSYSLTLSLDVVQLFDYYTEIFIREGLTEEEIAEKLEDMLGISSRDEAVEMSEYYKDQLINTSFFATFYEFILVIPEASNDLYNSINEAFISLFKTYYPDVSEEEIIEYVNNMLSNLVYSSDEWQNKISYAGSVSSEQPFETTFLIWDDYSYSVSLDNIPERYKATKPKMLAPQNSSMCTAVFNLELKRGDVHIVSKDKEDMSFLPATYQIIDESNTVIATISSLADGTQAVFEGLPYGEYTIIQTTVTEMYAIAEPQSFNVTEDGQLIEIEFLNDKASIYSVKVPKTIILDGANGTADIVISVRGRTAGIITVKPSAALVLEEQALIDKKNNIPAIITMQKSIWRNEDLTLDAWSNSTWHISAPLTAGVWSGILPITIQIE